MCAVIGFATKKKTKKQLEILYNLIVESKIRGLHAFGIAYYLKNKIITEKAFKIPDEMYLLNFINSDANMLISHNRYSTSGDWKKMQNNQPVTISNNISIVLNGVITMKYKKEYEKQFDVRCTTENDTEIFARKLQQKNNPIKILKELGGSFAAVYLYNKNIYAIRNNMRPLHMFKLEKAIFVCSTVDIVDRALKRKLKNIISIEPYKLVCLNEYI